MYKLWASVHKEFLLLIRDWGGLAILFLMPLLLVITITIIQDATFKTIQENKIPLLLVDNDKNAVSRKIIENLNSSSVFEIVMHGHENTAKALVQGGKYQLAVVIPQKLTTDLGRKVAGNVENILEKFGAGQGDSTSQPPKLASKEIKLYFDPATPFSFRTSIKGGIGQMVAKIESETIYKAFQEQLGDDQEGAIFDTEPFITFNEIVPSGASQDPVPNSTQHNIPAWTLFAMFFIILPLSINMVKEKNLGTFVRLRTNPIPYATVLGGKTLLFLAVAMVQFALMLAVGVFLFPYLGLPRLEVGDKLQLLFLVAFFAGLAAIGLGILLGTVARTQEQSAPFGATLVVILAALGGVWVPVFAMPKYMQVLSNLSPMNWGLSAFYDVFLRNMGFLGLVPEITLLFLFFVLTSAVAIVYHTKANAV